MSPEVSVVMGVRNGLEFLDATVRSVLEQRDADFEFIIVDDGSAEPTAAALARIARGDPRIRLFTQAQAGLTRALIHGCAQARGTYVARQDNGDRYLPGRLAAQLQAMRSEPDLAFVSCWTEYRGPGDEFLYAAKGSGAAARPTEIIDDSRQYGVIDGPAHHASAMFRLDRYHEAGGYRPQFYFGQDWDLWFRLAALGKFQMLEQVLHIAHIMPNSLSGRHKAEQERIAACSRRALSCRLRGEPEEAILAQAAAIRPVKNEPISRAMKARGLYFLGETLRRNGDGRASGYFRQALREYPWMPKTWVRLCQAAFQRKEAQAR